MTSELREAIRSAVARTRIEAQLPAAVLAAIEATGYVVVERARWERVMDAAQTGYWYGKRVELQPGDLDAY